MRVQISRAFSLKIKHHGCYGKPGVVGIVEVESYLLHDSSLALGERNVSARFVADKLDLNLATLATALLVVIVVVVAS